MYVRGGAVKQMTMKLLEMARSNGGYLTSREVTRAGIPRRELSEAVEAGLIIPIERGLYALPETGKDPLVVAQHRFARGIFSDDTALWLQGLSGRAPFSLTMTFPRSYHTSSAKAAGIICRSCAIEVFDLGLSSVATPHGNVVRAYDAERPLCDVARGHKVVDLQIVIPAMRAYVRSDICDLSKLIDYSRQLGVERKIRGYLEVLQREPSTRLLPLESPVASVSPSPEN